MPFRQLKSFLKILIGVQYDPFRSNKSPSLGFHPQGEAYTSFS